MKLVAVFLFALTLGTGFGLTLGKHANRSSPSSTTAALAEQTAERTSDRTADRTADRTSDAAFRDGLYQAKLAVNRGDPAHVSIGRWRSEQDRVSFAAGYLQGYAFASDGQKHKSNAPA